MKTIGIQIKSSEAILVVLELHNDGTVEQTNESIKLDIKDSENQSHIRQFRDQINSTLDSIKPDKIGVLARNAKAKGRMAPSPISFKLEGIIQLYPHVKVEIVWPQTTAAYYKKNPKKITPKNQYQGEACDVAFYLLKN